ncbi:MAG: VTT domain-containing protein [Balneolaceae bacterium]
MQYSLYTIKNRWIYVLFAIIALYVLSSVIQIYFPIESKRLLNQKEITIEHDSKTVSMSYLSFIEGEKNNERIVLLPDVFFGANHLIPIAKKLSDSVDVIIPVYPDTYSNGDQISQSIGSLSKLTTTLLDSLDFFSAHIAGQGFGNAVAIDLISNFEEELILSHIMISGIGVQEVNFLGYHALNTPLYSAVTPLLWGIHHLTPHAGWAHHLPLDFQAARFLSSLDQRQMRDKLTSITQPVLILHAEKDIHVPLSTANEHFRIVPHSELIVFEDGHESISTFSGKWSDQILTFIEKTNRGEAVYRSMATTDRVQLANDRFDPSKMTTVEGWSLIIIISFIFLISLFSEDLSAIGGGLVVASGAISFGHALIGCVSGILFADLILYWLGRRIGSPALKWVPFRWIIKEKDVLWAESMFNTNSMKIIFASRFIPGTRLPTYFTAGMVKADFKLFLFYFILSVIIWAPLLVGLSLLVGTQMLHYLEIYQGYALYIVIAVTLLVFLFIKVMMPLTTRKGRREFAVNMIRRKQRWLK